MMNELSLSYSAPIDINFIAACLCPEKYSAKVPATIWVPTNQIQASTEFELITNAAGNSFLLINPRRAGGGTGVEMVAGNPDEFNTTTGVAIGVKGYSGPLTGNTNIA